MLLVEQHIILGHVILQMKNIQVEIVVLDILGHEVDEVHQQYV